MLQPELEWDMWLEGVWVCVCVRSKAQANWPTRVEAGTLKRGWPLYRQWIFFMTGRFPILSLSLNTQQPHATYYSFMWLWQQISINWEIESTRDFIFLEFWRPEVWNPGVRRALLSPESVGENSSLPFSSFWGPSAFFGFLGLWTHHSSFCLCLHIPFCSVSMLISLCFHLVIEFNPG